MNKEKIVKSLNGLKKRYFLLHKTNQYNIDKSYRGNEQLTIAGLALEDSILGSFMIEPRIFNKTYNYLVGDAIFHNPKNQIIFEASTKLFMNSYPIGVQEIISQLKKDKNLDFIGGENYIVELLNNSLSIDDIEYIEDKIKMNNSCAFFK